MANTKPLASQVKYGSGSNTVDKTLKKAILSFPTLDEAQSAAATLPNGHVVKSPDINGILSTFEVHSGALTYLGMDANSDSTSFKVSGTNLPKRTVSSKLEESLSVMDFGAIGDGTLHPLSGRFSTLALAKEVYPHVTALTQSIDWAATQMAVNVTKSIATAPQGRFLLTDTVVIPDGVQLIGAGIDYWDSYRPNSAELPKSDAKGTHWYFVGTGTKKYTCDDLSNVLTPKVVGGVTFPFTNFTQNDSVAGSPATPRQFSVGFIISKNAGLSECRVIPSYNLLQGYIDGPALSDDWDVGIWALSPNDCKVARVQSVGHWRMAGVLLTEHVGTDSGARNPERATFESVWGTGVRGLVARNVPQYTVTAWTANKITVGWNSSFCLTRSNKIRIGSGSAQYTYTGYTFDSGNKTVTLTGITPALTTNPITVRGWNIGNNLSNTIFQNCIFSSIDHWTRANSTTFGLPVSGAAEYDGYPLRNIVHVNTVFQTTSDDLNTLYGGAYDFKYIACKHENGQMIAYNTTDGGHYTMNLRFIGEDGINDTTRLGGFDPRSSYVDSYQSLQTSTDGTYYLKPMPNKKLELLNQSGDTVLRTSATSGELYAKNGEDTGSIQIQDSGLMAFRGANYRFRLNDGTTTNLLFMDSVSVSFGVTTYFNATARPQTDNNISHGTIAFRWSDSFSTRLRPGAGAVIWTSGFGTPEGGVVAPVGSMYTRTNGSTGTTLYIKESGVGNTGWVAK